MVQLGTAKVFAMCALEHLGHIYMHTDIYSMYTMHAFTVSLTDSHKQMTVVIRSFNPFMFCFFESVCMFPVCRYLSVPYELFLELDLAKMASEKVTALLLQSCMLHQSWLI